LAPLFGGKVWERIAGSRLLKKFQKKILLKGRLEKNGKRPTSHRSTTYLCYVPILEDFAGAGRVGLAGANIQSFCIFASGFEHINYYCILQLKILNHDKT